MEQRSDSSGASAPKPGAFLPRATSAMGLVRNDSLSGLKASLLKQGRAETLSDLRLARIVRFNRASALADLSYLALPGLTTRVARRARIPSSAARGGAGIPKNASYLRLEQIGASRTGGLGEAELEALLLGQEEYVEETAGLTPALAKSAAVALLSSFMYGYNGGNMNTQAGVQRAALGIPSDAGAQADSVWSLCVSLFCVGALLGCNLSGALADSWGRKRYLLASAAIFAAGGLLEAACALPPAPPPEVGGPAWARIGLLIAGRLVTGVACGGATVVVPMYLGEVSPAHLRGTLGTAFQLCSVLAMLAAQVLGLRGALGTEALWPLVLGLVALPAALQLLLGGLLVESPRWLCMVGRLDDAQATLAVLRNASDRNDENVLEELDVMITSAEGSGAANGGNGNGARSGGKGDSAAGGQPWGQLLRPPTRYPLLIAVGLMGVQQFSGINNAFNFSSVFLKANGMDEATVTLIAILMNVGNVLVTLLSVYLMDKAGRRPLLLLSTGGMLAATAALTVALSTSGHGFSTPLSVFSVVLFVGSFGIGLGPVGWLLPAEIMPPETRALASSVAASTNWLANFIASQAFLTIANALGGLAFVPFGCCLVLGVGFIGAFVPETKGKSLEQIQAELALGSQRRR